MIGQRIAVLLAGTLAGCAVGPDYEQPRLPVPQKWTEAAGVRAATPPTEWWKTFGDWVGRLLD